MNFGPLWIGMIVIVRGHLIIPAHLRSESHHPLNRPQPAVIMEVIDPNLVIHRGRSIAEIMLIGRLNTVREAHRTIEDPGLQDLEAVIVRDLIRGQRFKIVGGRQLLHLINRTKVIPVIPSLTLGRGTIDSHRQVQFFPLGLEAQGGPLSML